MRQRQQVEYKTVKIPWGKFEDVAEQKLNEMAKKGWVLKEEASLSGNSTYYIFERPVE